MQKIPVRQIERTHVGQSNAWALNIRDVGTLLGGRDLTGDLHRHDFYYILALKHGEGIHDIDFTTHTISVNSVFIIRPGQVHRVSLRAGAQGYLFSFNGEFYADDSPSGQLLRRASCNNHYKLDDHTFNEVHSQLGGIHKENSGKQPGYIDVIKAHLTILLTRLARENSCIPASQERTLMQERLDHFQDLLSKHIVEYKQPSEYAGMLNVSPYQLNAITKTVLGKTSSDVITDYIILESKRHLLGTSSQVNQIAGLLGYDDTSYFIRFFKKHTGLSPEAFRHNFR